MSLKITCPEMYMGLNRLVEQQNIAFIYYSNYLSTFLLVKELLVKNF